MTISPQQHGDADDVVPIFGADAGAVPGTQALRKGIALLEMVASQPLRFGELSARTGLPKGTLHRILATLIETGLLRFDKTTQTYRLGVRLSLGLEDPADLIADLTQAFAAMDAG